MLIKSIIQLTIWKEGCAFNLDNSPKAVETLIEIARKYQKIQEIMAKRPKDMISSNPTLRAISEVDKMGLTIDDAIKDIELTCDYLKITGVFDHPANEKCKPSLDMAIDTMRKYQMMQADYEARLKTDMVAMLTELQTEIEEQLPMIDICDYAIDSCVSRHEVASIIQQKINALKENKEE